MPTDNWEHRSANMRCGTCMHFSPKAGDLGRCRKHAPTLDGWPAVFKTDWCGDHKLDEEKLEMCPSLSEMLEEHGIVT